MKPIKQVSLEEWESIGEQSKKVRNEMMLLLNQTKGLPKSVTDTLRKSVQILDRFRSQAEDRMMNTGASDDVHIFYGNN
jgi:hypothetical protein